MQKVQLALNSKAPMALQVLMGWQNKARRAQSKAWRVQARGAWRIKAIGEHRGVEGFFVGGVYQKWWNCDHGSRTTRLKLIVVILELITCTDVPK